MKFLVRTGLLCGLFFLLSGCFFMSRPVPSDRAIYQVFQINDIQAEINRRENLDDPDIENHFALVVLYTHPRNHHPDFQAAERHLNEYLVNLTDETQDWQARYIYFLLQRICEDDEVIGRTQEQLELEITERRSLQLKTQSDQEKIKSAWAALQKSKKESGQLRFKLKNVNKKLGTISIRYERQQIENEELKKQLKNLTNLYLDLEKKRKAMQ